MEIELAERRIPFFLVQASREWRPTYLEWALQPVTALLSLAAGAETAESWEAALRPYVGSVQAKLLAAAADWHRAAQEMGQRVTLRWQAFGRDLAELSAKRALPPVLLGELAARMTKSHGRAIEWAIAALARFASLERFATHVRTLHALSSTPHDRRIRLSTVHRAKGTEGKIVFVLGLSEGFFPLADAEEAEERRVCYVAFSRARDFLLATSPRSVGGRRTPRSRFLREAGLQRLYFPSAEKIRSLIQRAVTPFPDPAGQDDRHHTLPGAAVMPRAQRVGVVPLHNDKPHHEVPGTEKVGHGSLGSSRYRTPRRRNS